MSDQLPVLRNEGGVLELARELENAGFLTSTGLDLERMPDLDYDQLESLVAFFFHLGEVSLWGLYDSLLAIEMKHGDLVYQAATLTGRRPQTIDNNLSIARRVPKSRRREGVHFTTHSEVAALPPNDQRRWLKVAKEEGLTKDELRARVRAEKHADEDLLPPLDPQLCPHCGQRLP